MPASRSPLCYCGSGRPLTSCHELPSRERRRRAGELRALAEAHDVSALFPDVRPRDPVVLAYAEQVAATLPEADPRVPVDLVERGLALLSEEERRRIPRDWASRYADRWASVCAAAGDTALVERIFAASAVRGAISERRPVPRGLCEVLEDGRLRRSPCAAVALVVAPPIVWARDDALITLSAVSVPASVDRVAWFRRVEAMAAGVVAEEHVERVRAAAARITDQLPIEGLPRTSATLAEGCARIAEDGQAAAGVAGVLLAAYVLALAELGSGSPLFVLPMGPPHLGL